MNSENQFVDLSQFVGLRITCSKNHQESVPLDHAAFEDILDGFFFNRHLHEITSSEDFQALNNLLKKCRKDLWEINGRLERHNMKVEFEIKPARQA
jgi:hypothetical protein